MTPPLIEKKRVLLLAVCALATGVAPVACSADSPGTSSEPYDSGLTGSSDSPYDDVHPEGNVLIPYDAYVETDSDVDDAADADTNDDGG